MVLKFFSSGRVSGGTGLVALVLAEKRIPFQHIHVDLSRQGQKSPEHLARQPFGQVPVIDDDGFVLYESRAICRYLAEKYPEHGPNLLPGPTIRERALFEQAASVEFADFHIFVVRLAGETVGKALRGLPIDPIALSPLLAQLGAKLDVYERILSRQAYIAGNELSLVDLFHLNTMPIIIDTSGLDIMSNPARPNVARWWESLTTRPAWIGLRRDGIRGTVP
ncbi:Glutathione S-transferase [Mycena indigotica]|uniref:glutathione transferase n=1 Tax=Mycena indigotica TaxID=2126181 RepID=A0A8H6S3F9_9AGAR|nr:Glutathione S-transferase [Mycena indigotica]KAF7291147.1 Glutathione S-transferase [Mycena indigotica]